MQQQNRVAYQRGAYLISLSECDSEIMGRSIGINEIVKEDQRNFSGKKTA